MTKKYYLIFILLFLLVFHIGDKNSLTAINNMHKKGKVSITFDRNNFPTNIVKVNAYLSNPDFPQLLQQLNFPNDSTNKIVFFSVPIGKWHLEVFAKNSNDHILYSSETELNVNDEQSTDVNLGMKPVLSSTGDTNIKVTWSTKEFDSTEWIDYPHNPILSSTGNYWDTYGPNQSKLIYDHGYYKMWFGNLTDKGRAYVCYAFSKDGDTWTRPFNHPVLEPGNSEKWDSGTLGVGPVIKENKTYKMYYTAWSNQNRAWHIGLATSKDGINWQKYPTPVLFGKEPEDNQIIACSIVKVDNLYHLYYTSRDYPIYNICLAYSSNGINWKKYRKNPILKATSIWEGSGVYNPSVIKDDTLFKMVYQNSSTISGFGLATSKDGINWIKDKHNPFFSDNHSTINWGIDKVLYPCLIKMENEYRVYYTGKNSVGQMFIGYVSKKEL